MHHDFQHLWSGFERIRGENRTVSWEISESGRDGEDRRPVRFQEHEAKQNVQLFSGS